ncbi:MAG TPA: lysylphosphatidylglycerol synthase domain-containing protein [Tepidisphaeraceae bacterium]|nr:lysylphosphatidylglycerol synthase domain-containing protein [Tepidisphaeraceae bacterium]
MGIVITAAIFAWIFKPIVQHWEQVKDRIHHSSGWRVLVASLMFAAFLFAFRASTWRRILVGFGHRIPMAPAVRIWSSSELSRYLPGVIWQVVSRIYLVRPYGVRGSVCSASQMLELILFLLANVLLAVSCLIWLGYKTFHGAAYHWLIGATGLLPVLLILLYPKVFYGIADQIMRRLGKPQIARRLRFRELCGLLVWNVLGLIWQSLAIWLIVSKPLGLEFTKWWVVAGAYCLAWCAGFLAFWAPGGIGVRELVFVTAMEIALPPRVRATFDDPAVLLGFLAFLSVLLRIWATTGELILAGLAYAIDYRGALGRPDAPGRVTGAQNLTAKETEEPASVELPAV